MVGCSDASKLKDSLLSTSTSTTTAAVIQRHVLVGPVLTASLDHTLEHEGILSSRRAPLCNFTGLSGANEQIGKECGQIRSSQFPYLSKWHFVAAKCPWVLFRYCCRVSEN